MNSLDPELIWHFRSASHFVALTGAGVSAESGVPTFRDSLEGFWERFDPTELAMPAAFEHDSELVTRWYDQRRLALLECKPNAGHFALAELQSILESQGRRFTLITQNVDRLHQAAGSTEVIELHGSLWQWQCTTCSTETDERGPTFERYPARCSCGGIKRPGVVWFGEMLPIEALHAADLASRSAEIFMSLGTSSAVYPAAGLIDTALQHGAMVLEVNPTKTEASLKVHWAIREASGRFMPKLVAGLKVSESQNRSR